MNTIAIRQRLLQRRLGLLARYHDELDRADEELAMHDPELVERASEEWDARVLTRLGDHDAAALTAVTDALGRLAAGTYGTCLACGQPIDAARLDAVPTTATCFVCADQTSTRRIRAQHGSHALDE